MRKLILALVLVLVSSMLFACGPQANSQTSAVGVTKVLVFIEENHSLNEMQSGMPYTFSLAQQYGYANNWKAIRHPSLPNYIAIASGKTYGIADDDPPSIHQLSGTEVFDQAIAKGKTAKTYADGMPSNCYLDAGGTDYAVKHNPWAYFVKKRTNCNKYDVPFANNFNADVSAGTLPNIGFVIPNLCNDAHNCSLSTADAWFQARMQTVLAGPDWQSGKLAIVLTADEDDRTQSNKVLTMVVHPSQATNVVSTPLNHYSLTRFLEQVVGASYLNHASTATDMATAFAIPIG